MTKSYEYPFHITGSLPYSSGKSFEALGNHMLRELYIMITKSHENSYHITGTGQTFFRGIFLIEIVHKVHKAQNNSLYGLVHVRQKFMMTSWNGNIFHLTGQWCGALMFSLIYTWISCLVNNREADDLKCYHAHYDVTVMWLLGPMAGCDTYQTLRFNERGV